MTASTSPLVTETTDAALLPLLDVIQIFREWDREVPAQVVITFLYIASHDGCHKQVLEADLEFGTATCSRNVAWLSDEHRLNKPGLGLIWRVRDVNNQRRIRCFLTPKGKEVAARIKSILYPTD